MYPIHGCSNTIGFCCFFFVLTSRRMLIELYCFCIECLSISHRDALFRFAITQLLPCVCSIRYHSMRFGRFAKLLRAKYFLVNCHCVEWVVCAHLSHFKLNRSFTHFNLSHSCLCHTKTHQLLPNIKYRF